MRPHFIVRSRAPLSAILLLIALNFSPAARAAETIKIRIDAATVISTIPSDFVGFGYETSAAAQPDFFSAKNPTMIRLYRNLGATGLIRIGGNVSDHTQYVADGTPAVKTEREITTINRQNLLDLGEFARATGWKVMWGLNLGTGTKEQAVEEAVAVEQALGDRLHSLQVGNEVDLMQPYRNNYDAYHAAYRDFKAAIRKRLPQAVFSGPDSASNVSFVEKFVTEEAGDMSTATYHYYRSGARNRNATMEFLLQRDDAFNQRLDRIREACAPRHIPYRINEVNSFSGGGKAGVSDTFGEALWALDYMFNLAAHGCSGINLETDINQLGFISHYSPIVHDGAGKCSARPEYYAMLAFAMAGRGQLLKTQIDAPKTNLAAYSTRDPHGIIFLAIINKDLAADVTAECASPSGNGDAELYWLGAPASDAKSGVTFAASTVADDGSWSAGKSENSRQFSGNVTLTVPHASALIVRFAPAQK